MRIHQAAEGFSRSAREYERGRPGYPAEAVEFLAAQLGFGPGKRVLDLAAGTGKLTYELLRSGAGVVAVEPLAAMREAIRGAEVLAGTAEAIPLPDASVDAVTVGQAFHWFDGDAALTEIHRVLRHGGGLGLIWNRRDDRDPLQRHITELIEPYRGTAPSHSSLGWHKAFERTMLFAPLESRTFPSEQRVDREAFADRVASISFVSALSDAEREPLLEAVRGLVAPGELVVLPYSTEVFWTKAMSR